MKSQTRAVKSHDRKLKALELRKAGYDYRRIGETLGCSVTQAHRDVAAALKLTLQEPADDVRALEVERLDNMLRALWRDVSAGNHGAIDRALRVMERRAKLLGLDAPTRTETTGANGEPVRTDIVIRYADDANTT